MVGEPRGTLLPRFESPPVTEVAVGVHFLPLPGLNVVELVRLNEMWSTGFPTIQEQPALPPVSPPGAQSFHFFSASVPPTRLWNISVDGRYTIQIQNDRLLFNWKKIDGDDSYPEYTKVRRDFERFWGMFASRVAENPHFGVLQASYAEVTFFNAIDLIESQPHEWISLLNSAPTGAKTDTLRLQTVRSIISNDVTIGGQTLDVGYGDGAMTISIETRVAIDVAKQSEDSLSYLDFAHDEGVWAFDGLTTDWAHEQWGKK